jgi:hypothetical protein
MTIFMIGSTPSADMVYVLAYYEVLHSISSPYSPHQDGIAQRFNHAIFDLAAVMNDSEIDIKQSTHLHLFF